MDFLDSLFKRALFYETKNMFPGDKAYLKDYYEVLKEKSLSKLSKELRQAFHVCDEKKAKLLLENALKKNDMKDVCKTLLLLIEETERTAFGPAVFKLGIKTWVLSYVIKDYEILRYLYHEVLKTKLKPWLKKKVAVAVLEPDMHEYGAIYGQIALELAGFEVINLGYNLKPQEVIKKVKAQKIDVLVLTSILSDPYSNMMKVIDTLKNDKTLVVVSGTMPWEIVKKTNADGYINCLAYGPKVLMHITGIKKYTEEEVPILI